MRFLFAVQPPGLLWKNVDPDVQGLNAVWNLLANVINLALFVAGVLAMIYVLYGGLQYILSSGNPANTAKAKNTITYAVVGLVIVIMALVIVNFVRGLFK